MPTVADELAERTLEYWRISHCRNGHSVIDMEIGAALGAVTNIVESLNPARPLVGAALRLRWDIIEDAPPLPVTTLATLLPYELGRIKYGELNFTNE